MSAYPLPTKGCECGTCKWLRDSGIGEAGPIIQTGASNAWPPDIKFDELPPVLLPNKGVVR